MDASLGRKRSRLALDADSDDDSEQRPSEPSPALSAFSDTLKRSKTQSELEDLDIVSPDDAWTIDLESILASHTLARPEGSSSQSHDNTCRYRREESITVLCVQGNLHLHYDLLCSILPDLYSISPALQAFVLCRDPATHIPSESASISLPLIQAVSADHNHFVRLGLLHPLGGGRFPLDALVVLDPQGRRRLVLPFGWGAGRHAATPAGRVVQTRLMNMLRNCVQTLAQQR